MTTPKQKAAVKFCEQWLSIEFTGDIENKTQVSRFLSEFLQEAQSSYNELKCEYETYLMELYD